MQRPTQRNVMPPMRQPSKTWDQRVWEFAAGQWRAADFGAKIGIILVGLVLVPGFFCACISCAAAGVARQTAQQSQYVVSPAPTDTSAPASPPVMLLTGATIGGTFDGFVARFGNAADPSDWNIRIGGQPALLHIDRQSGSDGKAHVGLIDITPPLDGVGKVSWDHAAAETFTTTLLPADAQSRGVQNFRNGTPDHLFTSASLAATLGTDGRFDWFCSATFGSGGIDQCQVGLPLS